MSDLNVREALTALVQRAGLSQSEIAVACKCSQPNIAYHLNGEVKNPRPTATFISALKDLIAKHPEAFAEVGA